MEATGLRRHDNFEPCCRTDGTEGWTKEVIEEEVGFKDYQSSSSLPSGNKVNHKHEVWRQKQVEISIFKRNHRYFDSTGIES